MVKSVASFCLFGDNPSYRDGALHNAQQFALIYPGWQTWFYVVDTLPPNFISELSKFASRVIVRSAPRPSRRYEPLLWRFDPIVDPTVDIFVSRDCDSSPSAREYSFVNDWLKSGLSAHIIRDHPYHTSLIQAGLFGLLPSKHSSIFSNYLDLGLDFSSRRIDEVFLARYVYPRICVSTFFSTPCCAYEKGFNSDFSRIVSRGYSGEPLFSEPKAIELYRSVSESYKSSFIYRVFLLIRQFPSSCFYFVPFRRLYNVLSKYLRNSRIS